MRHDCSTFTILKEYLYLASLLTIFFFSCHFSVSSFLVIFVSFFPQVFFPPLFHFCIYALHFRSAYIMEIIYVLMHLQGRFLLAARSGRILAQSFHSVLHVGYEMIEQTDSTTNVHTGEYQPEIAWKRMELSVMLEHVQAHVAPTDVDLGAGVQWLPKILRGSPKVVRTGALLERVFMPCDMYFRFTRHKGGTPELRVSFLSPLL